MIDVAWDGWDGSHWDLRRGPVHLTDGGLEGLGHLEFEAFAQETALLDGQRFTGWRAKPRTVLLPVLVGQSGSEGEWIELERAWWKTLRPDKPGTLTVTSPDGKTRWLKLRLVDDGNMQYGTDPSRHRLSAAALNLIADDPWWAGPAFTQTFQESADAQNFFGGTTGFGPPFIITSGNTLGASTITNPGDIAAWPEYLITGEASEFAITIAGKLVSASIIVPPGGTLLVETAPSRQVATLTTAEGVATNVTRLLQGVAFTPIPAGASVAMNLSLVGPGSITVRGGPRYFRAW